MSFAIVINVKSYIYLEKICHCCDLVIVTLNGNIFVFSDEYILIDATNTYDIKTRKVAFADHRNIQHGSVPGLTMKNIYQNRPKSAKARLSRSLERRPRSATKTVSRSPKNIIQDQPASMKDQKVRKEYINSIVIR